MKSDSIYLKQTIKRIRILSYYKPTISNQYNLLPRIQELRPLTVILQERTVPEGLSPVIIGVLDNIEGSRDPGRYIRRGNKPVSTRTVRVIGHLYNMSI